MLSLFIAVENCLNRLVVSCGPSVTDVTDILISSTSSIDWRFYYGASLMLIGV